MDEEAATLKKLDFIIALATEQAEGTHQRLAAHLSKQFSPLNFGVGADEGDLADGDAFVILPILSDMPIAGSFDDAMKMKPDPEPEMIDAISEAVEGFLAMDGFLSDKVHRLN